LITTHQFIFLYGHQLKSNTELFIFQNIIEPVLLSLYNQTNYYLPRFTKPTQAVMSPSAISNTPPRDVQQTSELTAAAVSKKIAVIEDGPLPHLDASKLKITKTTTPMTVPQPGDPIINTSSQCTDHMITAVWTATTGWAAPELGPYGNLSLPPTASVLQ
jgi:hypothetical protein